MTHQNKDGIEALLPCPFCGSDDINTEGPCYTQFMCNGCGASAYDKSSREEAIVAWNRRAPDATSQAQLKIYREALEEVSKGIGSVRWMDPPDGGNVSLGEQVRRMRIDLETAERWRDSLREALTPSGDTKAAYAGEFHERIEVANPMHEGNEDDEPETITQSVPVSWTTIKEIMATILARSSLSQNQEQSE